MTEGNTAGTLQEQLESVEYLLTNGLWSNEAERMSLRARHVKLMDAIADAEGESA